MNLTTQALVVVGNVIDGLSFYGPFDDPQDAIDWASRESESAHGSIGDEDWSVTTMTTPRYDS